MQIYRSLLTFFSSLSSSRYFKFPNSTQQQKKTYHKAIKQSQTVNEQSPNHLIRHHVPTATNSDQGTPCRNQDLGHPRSCPKVTRFFRCLLAGEGRGKRREKPNTGAWYPAEYLSFNICSAKKLMFKAARVQEHLGVGVWGHIYPGWQKAWRYVKVFTFVFLAWWGSLRIKKTARIILHSKTILTNWKCREETFFKFFF